MELYEYTSQFKTLIARERNAEIDFYTNEIKSMSPFARAKKGRTLVNMVRQNNPKLENDGVFRFVRNDNQKFPHNEFNIGSNVLISVDKPLENSIKGVVVRKSGIFIDVNIDSRSNILSHKNLRIDLFVNDTTYQVQKKILEEMKGWHFEKGDIKEVLLHNKKPELDKLEELDFYDERLNPSQKLATKYALREKQFYLIQGPPGTGKTKTSIEIIRQHLKKKCRILVAADSNMAVDNIMLGLLKHIDVIRIGESPKIMDEIQEHTFGNIIKNDIRYMRVERGLESIKKLREKQQNCMIPSKKNAKGLSHFQIIKLAEREESHFGISYKKLRSMADWIIAQNELKPIRNSIDKIKKEIIRDNIEGASVICTTNTNASSPYLEGIEFDLVLIDEAGQSTEPSCLIPISKAKKVILVGDHKQLPPTILSEKAKELSVSLFERMFEKVRYTLLDTQYRMHPLINEFPSGEFYNGLLKSDESTELHRLKENIYGQNVVFVECNGKEMKHKGATSFYNEDEIEVLFDIVSKYAENGIKPENIGVISPYNGQVKKLKDRMPFIEVNSIDGFQGREKSVIIISLVRSNKNGNIGFLKDLRRLNVALTRAIDELVVIGNPETVSSEETYKRFIEFVKEKGTYKKL